MIKRLITLLAFMLVSLLSTQANATSSQVKCLAKAMYFEARGGQEKDLINIGNVVLNRTKHGSFPTTVCKVIADKKHAIQFPWYYNGLSVRDFNTYSKIESLAGELYDSYERGTRVDTVKGAVFFHAKRINPGWNYTRLSVNDTLHKYYKT